MDNRVGMFDAKTHFSEIVDRVLREGCCVTITRRGVPVVDIVPTREQPANAITRQEAIEDLERLRGEVQKLSPDEIVELVAQGRR